MSNTVILNNKLRIPTKPAKAETKNKPSKKRSQVPGAGYQVYTQQQDQKKDQLADGGPADGRMFGPQDGIECGQAE